MLLHMNMVGRQILSLHLFEIWTRSLGQRFTTASVWTTTAFSLT